MITRVLCMLIRLISLHQPPRAVCKPCIGSDLQIYGLTYCWVYGVLGVRGLIGVATTFDMAPKAAAFAALAACMLTCVAAARFSGHMGGAGAVGLGAALPGHVGLVSLAEVTVRRRTP